VLDGIARQDELIPLAEHYAAILHLPYANLRALQVLHDRDGAPGAACSGSDPIKALTMFFMGAVGEIQPSDVHAGINEAPDRIRVRGGRPKRTDDLCAAFHVEKRY
jgi:hypothetical protein